MRTAINERLRLVAGLLERVGIVLVSGQSQCSGLAGRGTPQEEEEGKSTSELCSQSERSVKVSVKFSLAP